MAGQCYLCGGIDDVRPLPSGGRVCKWCTRAHSLNVSDSPSSTGIIQPVSIRPVRKLNPVILSASDSTKWHAEWAKFYYDIFNWLSLGEDFELCPIPTEQSGYQWVVMNLHSLSLDRIWRECKQNFSCYSFLGDNLSQTVPRHERNTHKQTYAIRVRDGVIGNNGLDQILACPLVNMTTGRRMTLPERLLLELWHKWKTGKHLAIEDEADVTYCNGSRTDDGKVPTLYLCQGTIHIDRD